MLHSHRSATRNMKKGAPLPRGALP